MALPVTVAILSFIVPMVGLAIDGGIMYFVDASLSAAVDGSVLAAARSLNVGLTLDAQSAAATARANAWFAANFPPGYMFTTNPRVYVVIAESGYKTRTVTMAVSVMAPTYFMRMLGITALRASASGQAARRDVNLMIVADRSGSMNNNNACAVLRGAATQFIGNFSNGRDRVGLIEFGGTTNLDFAPSVNFAGSSPSLADAIANLTCEGSTNTGMAVAEAYQQLQAINEPGALNLILLFTDGRPTALSARFPVKTLEDTRWDYIDTSSAVDTPPSTCQDSAGLNYPNPLWNPGPITGILATFTSYWPTEGQTWGIDEYHSQSQGVPWELTVTSDPASVVQGCAFNGPFDYYASPGQFNARRDIAYIPTQDLYGNPTLGYQPLDTFPDGPYAGQIRPDDPATVRYAAYNSADNAATAARGDSMLSPIFYVIGLGGNDAEPIDHQFLERIANVPASAIYDSTRQQGLYIYSPSTQQLADAFATVAGEVLRISQ
jgi:Flp pilus assembly protein TadG